jgi:flavin reductase (DIM6/NTAB) family NADH-FMN oxidoreductase RutF
MTDSSSILEGVHPELFREVFRHWPSGVAIATSLDGDRAHGMVVGSFCSVSLDPPLVMISAGTHTRLHDILVRRGQFAISILKADQHELLTRFAGIDRTFDDDRFAGLRTITAETGCPIFPEALGWVDCNVVDRHPGTGYSIFVAHVVAASLGESADALPMVYFKRAAHSLA